MNYSIDQIKNMLRINKHRLDDELELQAEIHHHIAEQVATLNAKQAGLKEELEQCEAQLQLDFRSGSAGEKVTVAEVNAKILLDSDRITIDRKYQAARKEHEQWAGLLGAWQGRGYSLKTLADLYTSSYFAVDSGGRQIDYAKDRQRVADARATARAEAGKPVVPTRRRILME